MKKPIINIEYDNNSLRLEQLKIIKSLEDGDFYTEENVQDEDFKTALKDAGSKVKEGLKKAGDAAMSAISKMATKVKDFSKSSIAKINALPENKKREEIENLKSKVREDPKTLADMIKSSIVKAGKGAALAGLAMVSLPAAAAAVVGYGASRKKLNKNTIRNIKDELTKIDIEIEKADRDGDLDRKADLLILKRNTERAYDKLKYGWSPND